VMGVTEQFQPVSEHRGMYEKIGRSAAGSYGAATQNYASNL